MELCKSRWHLHPHPAVADPVVQIIAVITPYMVGVDAANLREKIFFVWGSLCFLCFIYAYFLVPETKGLTLEQVDRMLEETTPRTSSKWRPHTTFAADMGLTEKGTLAPEVIEDVVRQGSAV